MKYHKFLFVILFLVFIVFRPGSNAQAGSSVLVTGDCSIWSITDQAGDTVWASAVYFAVDGFSKGGAPGQGSTIIIPDTVNATRPFMVRWFAADGSEYTSQLYDATRDLSNCIAETTTTMPATTVPETTIPGTTAAPTTTIPVASPTAQIAYMVNCDGTTSISLNVARNGYKGTIAYSHTGGTPGLIPGDVFAIDSSAHAWPIEVSLQDENGLDIRLTETSVTYADCASDAPSTAAPTTFVPLASQAGMQGTLPATGTGSVCIVVIASVLVIIGFVLCIRARRTVVTN